MANLLCPYGALDMIFGSLATLLAAVPSTPNTSGWPPCRRWSAMPSSWARSSPLQADGLHRCLPAHLPATPLP
ncbi:MAG: QueT transporter family protein [Dysosmobacter sp.]